MIRQAEPQDLAAVLGLLSDAKLPTEGVADHFNSFLVVDEGDRIVAAVGLELHDDAALLRSLAVAPEVRGNGLGSALVRRALHEARGCAGGVYALTTTAETYLSRLGFVPVPRTSLPRELFQSVELQDACPDSAAVMKWTAA